MTRRLNPITGTVDDVDDVTAGLYDEWWRQQDTPAPAVPVPVPRPRAGKPPRKRGASLIIPWTDREVTALRDALPAPCAAIVDAGAGAGLREGELFALADDEISTGLIRVTRQVKRVPGAGLVYAPPKHGFSRSVELSAPVMDALTACRPVPVTLPWQPRPGASLEAPRTYRLLFTTTSGTPWDASNFARWIWKPALRDAGIRVCREHGTHAMRHTFASNLLAQRTGLAEISALLGHRDIATTSTYLHQLAVAGELRAAAVNAVAPPRAERQLPAGVADFTSYLSRRTS